MPFRNWGLAKSHLQIKKQRGVCFALLLLLLFCKNQNLICWFKLFKHRVNVTVTTYLIDSFCGISVILLSKSYGTYFSKKKKWSLMFDEDCLMIKMQFCIYWLDIIRVILVQKNHSSNNLRSLRCESAVARAFIEHFS